MLPPRNTREAKSKANKTTVIGESEVRNSILGFENPSISNDPLAITMYSELLKGKDGVRQSQTKLKTESRGSMTEEVGLETMINGIIGNGPDSAVEISIKRETELDIQLKILDLMKKRNKPAATI